jgi:hypothetical protein
VTVLPFVFEAEQLLAFLFRLPVWKLATDYDNVGAVTDAVFGDAAGAGGWWKASVWF